MYSILVNCSVSVIVNMDMYILCIFMFVYHYGKFILSFFVNIKKHHIINIFLCSAELIYSTAYFGLLTKRLL